MLEEVVNSRVFQRLKRVSQLGFANEVFDVARVHTRFEHSLGTMELCTRVLDNLSVPTTDMDRFCCRAAALMHDVGHVYGSHWFDRCILPHTDFPSFGHEQRSAMVVESFFFKSGLLSRGQVDLIKDILLGHSIVPLSRQYLVDIVSCKKEGGGIGVDVDRLDYLRRDALHLGAMQKKHKLDVDRIVKAFAVDEESGRLTVNTYIRQRVLDARKHLREVYLAHPLLTEFDEGMAQRVLDDEDKMRGINAALKNNDLFYLSDGSNF